MDEKESGRRTAILDLERRKYPRFKVNLPLDYYRLGKPANQNAKARDISQGGLNIYFPEELEVGEQLRLRLFFATPESDLESIVATAEVAWVAMLSGNGEYQSGVKLVDIRSEDLTKLKTFLATLAV